MDSKRLKDYLDYLAAYGCMGAIMWFATDDIHKWFLWLIMALVLHFCLASRLYFELKMRRKRAMKKYYQGRKNG